MTPNRAPAAVASSLLAMAVLTGAATAQAVDDNADRAQQIEAILRTLHGYGLFNGSALVATRGEVIYENGFGWANAEWQTQNTPDTRFRLASVTKQFTAVVVLQLADDGSLDLNATISEYLPDYRGEAGEEVTIHQLLNHTSGIPSYTDLPGFFQDVARNPYPVDRFVAEFCSGPLQFEPGTRFRYSNSGYYLLGAIIEAITGAPYEDVVHERIFEPLGMTGSGYDRFESVIPKRAAGYSVFLGELEHAPYVDMSLPYAAGALYSTVQDLLRWDRALHGDELLSEASRRKMYTPGLGNYGYGWHVERYPRGRSGEAGTVVMHGGGIQGFSTFIVRMLEDEHLIVLLTNTNRAPLMQLAGQIQNVLYDRPVELPPPPVADGFYRSVLDRGIEAGLEEYREILEQGTAPDVPNEAAINEVGYDLLRRGRVDDAITIFRFNVEAYPRSWNVFDSLGEAYMVDGQRDLSIRNYVRSLEVNPSNDNGRMMLRRIGEDPDVLVPPPPKRDGEKASGPGA